MDSIEKLNVLCIEDDLAVADYISSLLDKKKYRVRKINDGKKALDFILSSSEHLDIILLDNYLPSLNGIQILKELKTRKKKYPIIFLTVDDTLETAVLAMKEGAIDYLSKSTYLKAELNIKIEKAYQLFKERLKKDFYEEQLSILSQAIEQSPNSVVITNKDGEIEYINKKFTQYTGYNFDEVKGKNPRILKTDSYEPGFFEKLWNTITSGKIWKGEFVNRKKNGELFYEKASITPIRNKSGEIVSYLGIKEDITELKKMGEALTKKNEEMDRFFTVVADLLCIIDNTTQKFIRLNKAWENTLGYSINELTGKSYIDFVHPDDIELTLHTYKTLVELGRVTNFVNRYKCKNGDYKFIEWSAINNDDGTSYSSAHDITERKLNELAIKESETRFRSIFEMANAGIFFSDKNGQLILVNQALQDMVEYSNKELYLMDFNQFTHLDDLAKENEMLQKLISGMINQYRIEKRYVSKSGKITWVDLAIAVIRKDSGDPLYYVGVVNDISERKQYEQQLKSINSTKDKFFSIISHDLRNQFSGILGLSEVLMVKKNVLNETSRDKYISLLYQSSESALALLENLLEWSRLQLNRLELNQKQLPLFDIGQEVYSMIENQSTLKQITVENAVDKNQQILADRNMITTVLRNILNNAIKFTPIGGQIVISSWYENKSDFISIRDTGIGMTQETINKLFKIGNAHSTYGTEKEKGSGLGLILCREFINKHGGEINIRSEVGKGSEFIISLPSKS
jgi:two-component system, sporulation sensor kinase E